MTEERKDVPVKDRPVVEDYNPSAYEEPVNTVNSNNLDKYSGYVVDEDSKQAEPVAVVNRDDEDDK